MSVDLAFAALGIRNTNHSLLIMPALRFAREWWLATHPTQKPDWDVLTPLELVAAYESERQRYNDGARITKATIRTRPVLAAICALAQAQMGPVVLQPLGGCQWQCSFIYGH